MGGMSMTTKGVLWWFLPCGNVVALRQFRDNVMVAAKGPAPHTTMYTVCHTLEAAWGLDVQCPCRDKNPAAVCSGACMTNSF